jgi:hypothetical protein
MRGVFRLFLCREPLVERDPCATSDNGGYVNLRGQFGRPKPASRLVRRAPPLGHTIPQVFPLPPCVHLPLSPHPLERIAQGLLCLEIDPELLRAEAFRMRTEQGHNPLAHLPPWSASLALPWLPSLLVRSLCISSVTVVSSRYREVKRFCSRNVTVRISHIIVYISNVTVTYSGTRHTERL